MNLLAGLEKFGLDVSKGANIFEDEDSKGSKKNGADGGAAEHVPAEEEFLLDKNVRCRICDQVFKTKMVKNGRVKSLKSDKDLRPRTQYIDRLKYGITSCPYCGYTALNLEFEHLLPAQAKLVKEEICSKFQATIVPDETTISYDEAIEKHKLSLINTIVKRGKNSEKAYTCLRISWLLRGKIEGMPEGTEEEKKAKEEAKQEEEQFYQQAYEGFIVATAKEVPPFYGLEQSAIDYLLAYMSYHFKKFEIASKYLASVIQSPSAGRNVKEMALDLKEQIVAEIKKKGA